MAFYAEHMVFYFGWSNTNMTYFFLLSTWYREHKINEAFMLILDLRVVCEGNL